MRNQTTFPPLAQLPAWLLVAINEVVAFIGSLCHGKALGLDRIPKE